MQQGINGTSQEAFGELLALIMADVGKNDLLLRFLEVVVFEVGGEEDVGVGGDSVGDEESACAATDGDLLYGWTDREGVGVDPERLEVKERLHLGEERGGRNWQREGANHTATDVGATLKGRRMEQSARLRLAAKMPLTPAMRLSRLVWAA